MKLSKREVIDALDEIFGDNWKQREINDKIDEFYNRVAKAAKEALAPYDDRPIEQELAVVCEIVATGLKTGTRDVPPKLKKAIEGEVEKEFKQLLKRIEALLEE